MWHHTNGLLVLTLNWRHPRFAASGAALALQAFCLSAPAPRGKRKRACARVEASTPLCVLRCGRDRRHGDDNDNEDDDEEETAEEGAGARATSGQSAAGGECTTVVRFHCRGDLLELAQHHGTDTPVPPYLAIVRPPHAS